MTAPPPALPPDPAPGAAPSGPLVRGVDLDPQTRCVHWRTGLDVVALRLACCAPYWACRDCHDALADHPAVPVPREDADAPHVLCGVCRSTLTVRRYHAVLAADRPACPRCGAGFNPGCARHSHLYVEAAPPSPGGPAPDPVGEGAA